MRDEHEIYLLEVRQLLKDKEIKLRTSSCVDLFIFGRVRRQQMEVEIQLLNYRLKKIKNKY